MDKIGTRYDPRNLEKKWYKIWEEKGHFKPSGEGEPYTIVIPPPNITAQLHMGHALNITLQDILIRYKRMRGYNTLWIPGEDHAGIATQNTVEKKLAEEGIHRKDMGREEFLKKVWDWAGEYRKRIVEQIKAIGASCDWSREHFTLDENLNKAVRKAFVSLYKEGYIYRGKYIINWCPRCGTVLSDEEVEHEELEGKFYYIKYYFSDSDKYITIATTRPETMLADTAVAVHPGDDRFKHIIGKEVILPLMNRKLKIIGDPYVDPEFGTGCLKVTPAHDPNDFQIGLRNDLELIEVIDENAKINENGGKYAGLDRYKAREAVVNDLEEKGYLEKIETMQHSVGKCYRCGTIVEPSLSDQWYVKMKPLAERAKLAVQSGEVVFHPERWEKVYIHWLDEIRDWCISRQLWWGHRIPVWYCQDCGKIIVEEETPEECPDCQSKNLKQDEDVLDTWFSSQLWPFTTLGWPDENADLEKYYPTSVLVTAFDIIFFWVARMIMAGYHFKEDKPFSDVYIHQLIRDRKGRKMSKSLGNGIDPLEVIEEYGADPMRFTLAILAAQGKDIKLDTRFIDAYHKFANKIWNATRFVLMNIEDYDGTKLSEGDLKLEDKWILSRLQKTQSIVSNAIDSYDFNIAAKSIYNFFWSEFCDWYIESVKPRLNSDERTIVQNVLISVLDSSFRLLHPFMPFITEELWQKLDVEDGEIIASSWPELKKELLDEDAEEKYSLLMDKVRGIRNVKADLNIPPTSKVQAYFTGSNPDNETKFLIETLANCEVMEFQQNKLSNSVTAYAEEKYTIYVKLVEIDVQNEIKRLEKKLNKSVKEVERFRKKLSNEQFLKNAPEEIIEETKEKLQDATTTKEKLERLIEDLK
ncbi:MAG: valine--tRNA ligase [Thermotogota bacterium]|nr:valine--tRNA ligase [Thermotogota bacterium]